MITLRPIPVYFKVLALLLVSVMVLNAQQIKRIDVKDGLVSGTINAFERDSLGYLWIGSEQGLNRYSGVAFKTYKLNGNKAFKGKGIVDIINVNGELFLITSSGSLFKYNYKFDKFLELLALPETQFLSITQLNEKDLAIGLTAGFIVFDTSTNTSSPIQHQHIIRNRTVSFFKGNLMSGTSKGLHVFSYNAETKTLIPKQNYLANQDIIHFNIDHKDRIWVGTEVGGLFIIDGENSTKTALSKVQNKTYAVRHIAFDNNNKALIAVDRLGLFVLDEEVRLLNTYQHLSDDENSLSQNSIYNIYVDETNSYWVGVRDGGLNIIYENDNVFTNIYHEKNEPNSISNNSIRSIYQSKEGSIWFGTENGITKWEKDNWTNFNLHPKLFNTAVLSINHYDEKLLLGTYGEGLLSINANNGDVTKVQLDEKTPLKFVFHISNINNELWIGGSDGPLSFYKDGKLVHNFPIGLERSIAEGYDEIVYVGANSGLFEINKRNFGLRKLSSKTFNTTNEVFHLNLDKLNNCIWIASKNGLYKYNLSDESVVAVGQELQQQIGTVYSIQRDNTQNLYLACISGLWRYDIKNQLFKAFSEEDGLLVNKFGFGATAKFKDGQIAFGGPDGAVIFNPLDIVPDEPISDIFISNLQINGKIKDSTVISKNLNYSKFLDLNYDNNSIAFNFETVKFHGSKRNLYEWQLEGYDTIVKQTFGNQKITYSNLEPGTYTLKYSGYNADGLKAKERQIAIKIANPFWKTWWAFLLYLLILGAFAYLIFKISVANSQKKFDENRIKFFVEVAHDIRTPVSLIQLLVKQLSNQQDFEKSIELIQRNTENLNEYVTQLLDFQKINTNQLRLQVSKIDLKDCLLKIVNDFTPILQEKSIDIQVNVKHIPVWFDVPKMNRIFYNIVSNAIKYSNEGGDIKISSFLNDKTLRIDFKDNGIGIPEKQQELIFKRFTRGTNVSNKGIPGTGIGLLLSKKIVELHGGKILLESKENEGSTFSIVLPNGTEHYKEEDIVYETIQKDEKPNSSFENILEDNKQILLVEDNDELRAAVKKSLEQNFTIIEASNGKEGLLVALSKNPDLIITDVMMPEMDGNELCHLLKTNFKTSHIPIIMLTALSEMDDKIKGLETGADAYVEKPFNVEILKATIKNLIRSRENIRHLLGESEVKKELTPDERFLSDVIESIKEHLTDKDFSIDALCEMMGLSRSNLFRKLKGLIQMSPSDLILKIKLGQAEELMKQKKLSRISDIAYESGFHDPKYFSTLFKKHYAKTPKEYIENL